jgi:DivIVA domain-containing protein
VSTPPGFQVVLRGYDRAQVDALVASVEETLKSTNPAVRSQALELLGKATFRVSMRGYDRFQVDAYIEQARTSLQP